LIEVVSTAARRQRCGLNVTPPHLSSESHLEQQARLALRSTFLDLFVKYLLISKDA